MKTLKQCFEENPDYNWIAEDGRGEVWMFDIAPVRTGIVWKTTGNWKAFGYIKLNWGPLATFETRYLCRSAVMMADGGANVQAMTKEQHDRAHGFVGNVAQKLNISGTIAALNIVPEPRDVLSHLKAIAGGDNDLQGVYTKLYEALRQFIMVLPFEDQVGVVLAGANQIMFARLSAQSDLMSGRG